MEIKTAVQALGALAQESRLSIFRLLVRAGPGGMTAGSIGAELGLPPATLSFHLAGLSRGGLVQGRQEGRFVIYSADFEGMGRLLAFLTEDCCGGKARVPARVRVETKAQRKRTTAA